MSESAYVHDVVLDGDIGDVGRSVEEAAEGWHDHLMGHPVYLDNAAAVGLQLGPLSVGLLLDGDSAGM